MVTRTNTDAAPITLGACRLYDVGIKAPAAIVDGGAKSRLVDQERLPGRKVPALKIGITPDAVHKAGAWFVRRYNTSPTLMPIVISLISLGDGG